MKELPKRLDQNRLVGEQDGGPYLEVATLMEQGDEYVLHVSAGYGSEGSNDQKLYVLTEKPEHPLDHYASEGWLDPTRDQAEELTRTLGVSVIAEKY